ncbi:MAG: segregation/condensation protein A [Gemmatimonadetes bacterium]|nr:segregation/condensation protein A [Gemmatimonadota bacterium]
MVDLRTDPLDGAFVVEIERFTGPLDLLLHLIREQDVDIFDIPIAQITAQFLAAIEGIEQYGLDRAGEFLETAALLVRIKAQMVLPRRQLDGEAWEDPRAELVRRLLEYEHFREAAICLEQAESRRRLRHPRGFVPPPPPPVVVMELTVTWDELWHAALAVGERARPRPDHHVTPRIVPLEDKIGLIVRALKRIARVEFAHLVRPFGDKLHGVVTLLAGLELARRRELSMRQRRPFTPLWFYKRKDETDNAADPDR